MKINKRIVLIVYVLSFLFIPITVVADDSEEILGFTYENILPKNQIGDNTFFELMVKPGDKQTLKTKLTNLTNEEKTIKITVSNATSSSVGTINYGANKEELVGEQSLSIKDVIDYPNQVKLKPMEEKEVKFKLKIPKKKFDGIILGGIHLKEVKKKEESEDISKASLSNEYSFVYTISLQENETVIDPEFTSSGTKFDKMTYIGINNIKPTIASNVSINSILMEEENDKVINDFKVEGFRLAPNSRLKLPFEGTEELPIGKYRTVTTVTHNKKEWKFNSKFEVTKKNKKGVDTFFEDNSENSKLNPLVITLIIFSFVMTAGFIYFYLEKIKKKED